MMTHHCHVTYHNFVSPSLNVGWAWPPRNASSLRATSLNTHVIDDKSNHKLQTISQQNRRVMELLLTILYLKQYTRTKVYIWEVNLYLNCIFNEYYSLVEVEVRVTNDYKIQKYNGYKMVIEWHSFVYLGMFKHIS